MTPMAEPCGARDVVRRWGRGGEVWPGRVARGGEGWGWGEADPAKCFCGDGVFLSPPFHCRILNGN